jgi:hypothetical protein
MIGALGAGRGGRRLDAAALETLSAEIDGSGDGEISYAEMQRWLAQHEGEQVCNPYRPQWGARGERYGL